MAVEEERIVLLPDPSRRLPAVDPDDHALFISLGCALENLAVAAREEGYEVEVDDSGLDGEDPAITVHLRAGGAGDGQGSDLYAAIPKRQSTRRPYDGRTIPPADLRRLEGASRRDGVEFHLFTDQAEIEPLIGLVEEANRRQSRDPDFVEELIAWIRFNPPEVEGRRDGLTHAAMGLPPVPRWLGGVVMKRLVTPASQARSAARAIRSSSAMMLFTTDRSGPRGWVDLGRSFERVALTATTLDIKQAHMNMPCEVPALRNELRSHLALGGAEPLLLLRIGYSKAMPASPRRPIEETLMKG